jgi:hypothetical protein
VVTEVVVEVDLTAGITTTNININRYC